MIVDGVLAVGFGGLFAVVVPPPSPPIAPPARLNRSRTSGVAPNNIPDDSAYRIASVMGVTPLFAGIGMGFGGL